MKIKFLLFLVIVFVEFIIGTMFGENKGTKESVMFYPIIITIGLGLIYFLVSISRGKK